MQYLKNGCTQYFTSPASEKKLLPSQKSQQQQARGGLKDPMLDDVDDFNKLDQVNGPRSISFITGVEVSSWFLG